MNVLFFCLIAAILLFSLLLFRAYQNTKDVVINTITMFHSKIELNQNHFTILHLSDIHLENISITPEELYEKISNQKIDFIALTGDFLDRKRSIPKIVPYLKVLKKANPTYGIFAVFGNHDYFLRTANFQRLQQTLEENGCHTLRNEHLSLEINGEIVNIIGIDDYCTNRSDIQKAYKELPKGYNLIITHDPNIVLDLEDYHYDYLLSGHFHGGQIHWPKPYHLLKMGKLVRKNMVKGLHYHDGKPFYISEGLGQTGVNIRVGSRPEITIHDISV